MSLHVPICNSFILIRNSIVAWVRLNLVTNAINQTRNYVLLKDMYIYKILTYQLSNLRNISKIKYAK